MDFQENLLPLSLQRQNATFIDLNPRLGENQYPELLVDEIAIMQGSIANLLQCPVGDRGKIFQPEYGTMLYEMLQEPLDELTAMKMRAVTIHTIEKWEPRVELLHNATYVQTNYDLPGYIIQVAFVTKITRRRGTGEFAWRVA